MKAEAAAPPRTVEELSWGSPGGVQGVRHNEASACSTVCAQDTLPRGADRGHFCAPRSPNRESPSSGCHGPPVGACWVVLSPGCPSSEAILLGASRRRGGPPHKASTKSPFLNWSMTLYKTVGLLVALLQAVSRAVFRACASHSSWCSDVACSGVSQSTLWWLFVSLASLGRLLPFLKSKSFSYFRCWEVSRALTGEADAHP